MDKADVKKAKQPLNILEIAATDKENLSSKVHKKKMSLNSPKSGLSKKSKKTLDNRSKNTNTTNVRKSQTSESSTILASDLTIDNPSENYWKDLAESRRKALEIALKENVDLHNKVNELEYENSRLKSMVDEAKALVEVLTEMIEERPNEDSNESADDSTVL